MSVLGGLTGATRGSVVFAGGALRPPLGSVGIVPQKNVLFPELTCRQTVKVWSAIKPRAAAAEEEEIVQVLRDCDLADKLDYMADALSGGQKRKLQLAIGLVGGSESALLAAFECGYFTDVSSPQSFLWTRFVEQTLFFWTCELTY